MKSVHVVGGGGGGGSSSSSTDNWTRSIWYH